MRGYHFNLSLVKINYLNSPYSLEEHFSFCLKITGCNYPNKLLNSKAWWNRNFITKLKFFFDVEEEAVISFSIEGVLESQYDIVGRNKVDTAANSGQEFI